MQAPGGMRAGDTKRYLTDRTMAFGRLSDSRLPPTLRSPIGAARTFRLAFVGRALNGGRAMAKTLKFTSPAAIPGKVTRATNGTKVTKAHSPPLRPTKTLTAFYSWQSDLSDAANRNGIRNGLQKVKKALKSEVRLVIDEATRDTPGSPHIPSKIFEKIRACDIFLADVTTITGKGHAGRACANPNVAFELGYAASQVGWDRIILLVNTAVSPLSDLPFDFDRHRVMTYAHGDKPTPEQKKALEASLKVGVEAIAKHDPPRARDLEGLSTEQILRQRDVANITWALEQVHQPSLDDFVETMPSQLRAKILWYFENFRGVVSSSLFHISDADLAKLFDKWLRGWGMALSGGAHFHMASNPSLLVWSGDRDQQSEKALKRIRKGLVKMETARQAVLEKIRETYVEIDIDVTNKAAFNAWRRDED